MLYVVRLAHESLSRTRAVHLGVDAVLLFLVVQPEGIEASPNSIIGASRPSVTALVADERRATRLGDAHWHPDDASERPIRMRLLMSFLTLIMLPACGSDRVTLPVHGLSVEGDRIGVHNNCHEDPRLDVEEDGSRIELHLSVKEVSGGDCFRCTFVTLNSPVGDRTVVDASTDEILLQDGLCFDPP